MSTLLPMLEWIDQQITLQSITDIGLKLQNKGKTEKRKKKEKKGAGHYHHYQYKSSQLDLSNALHLGFSSESKSS